MDGRRNPVVFFYMQNYEHKCIKCSTSYTDTDPDAYLCKSCNDERLKIAKEVDKKFGSTVGQVPTGMFALEQIAKERGRFSEGKDPFGRPTSQMFISTKDAGLTL